MAKKQFYSKQDKLTVAKIAFYQEYVEGYLAKILMTYGKCFVADLFSGPGKSGSKKGSPLVLIEQANYILTMPQLKKKDVKVYILFNEVDGSHLRNLNTELKKIRRDTRVEVLPLQNKEFEKIYLEIVKEFKDTNIPKFFFLDPFTYSIIKMEDLRGLMSLKNTEVLLFLPVFHSYRFANNDNFKCDHKTRTFIENYTTKGIYDYSSIFEFMDSMKEKLKQELNLDFVRPILLDAGSRKNALFLLTKHEKGMLLMNKLCIKKSKDGSGMSVGENYESQTCLFGKGSMLEQTSRYKDFENNMLKFLGRRRKITNIDAKKFAIEEEFRPQDAKNVLEKLRENGSVRVSDSNGQISKRIYMSESDLKETCYLEYIGESCKEQKIGKLRRIRRKSLLYKSKVDYGGWTINHIVGCAHGCKFPCYAHMMAKRFGWVNSYEDWRHPKVVENALELLDKELPKLKEEIDVVHLSFMTDPFMYDAEKQESIEEIKDLTLNIIEKLNKENIRVTTLTKGLHPSDLLDNRYNKNNEYGITLVSLNKKFKERFEPYSASYDERIDALKNLSQEGRRVWVSMEPYPTPNLDPDASNIEQILNRIKFVDKIIFGKLNYNVQSSNFENNAIFYKSIAKKVISFCDEGGIECHIKTGTPLSSRETLKILQNKSRGI